MKMPEAALAIICLVIFGPAKTIAQNFRIATYNVNFANTRGDQVLDAIAEAAPNVLCLQETTLQSEEWLRKQLASANKPAFHNPF